MNGDKSNVLAIVIAVASIVVLLAMNSMFILEQTQIALVTQFGEPVAQEETPGLKFKVPFIQTVTFFDRRIQNLTSDTTEVIASDQKNMSVDSFAKYRIVSPLKFYQSVRTDIKLKSRLAPILDSSLRQVLGGVPFKALLSPERALLMQKIRNIVNSEAETFGVEIVDVRIMRADLPDKSREAVYRRMKADREKEAKEIRAQGDEQAEIIRAKADKQKQVMLAEAKKQADIIRGEGDAEAIKAFASAFGKDPQFYDFYRTMEAYKKSINSANTKMLLSPDGEFMKFFAKPY